MVSLFDWHRYGCGPFAHFIMFPELLFRVPLWWVSHIWWFISSKYAWLLLTWARCTFSLGSDLMEQSFHQHVSQLGSNSVKIFQKGSLFPQALVSFCTFVLHPPSFIMKHVRKTFYLQKQGFRLQSNISNGFWKVSLNPKENIAQRLLVHNSWDLMEHTYSYDSLVVSKVEN